MAEALTYIKVEKVTKKCFWSFLLVWNFLNEGFLDSGKGTFTFASQIIRGSIVLLSLKYLGSVMKDSNKQCLNKNSTTIYSQIKKILKMLRLLPKHKKRTQSLTASQFSI